MDVTKSQNPDSMVLASAKIEFTKSPILIAGKNYQLTGLEDLGLARGISITPSAAKIEVLADNGTVPLKGQLNKKMTVAFSLLERHIPMLGKLFDGNVSLSAEAGTLTNAADDYEANSLVKGTPYPFKLFNHDFTEPGSIALSQEQVPLTEGDDYIVTQFAGAWYFTILEGSAAFDPAAALSVTYTVTPAKSYTMSQGSSGIFKPLGMRLTNKRVAEDGRIISRTWELPYGFCTSDDVITLKSKNDTDSVAEVPLSFEFSPHPDMISDADLEKISLIREIQEV